MLVMASGGPVLFVAPSKCKHRHSGATHSSGALQGRCEAAPGDDLEVTGEPLRDLLPEQCVFITDRPLLAQYYGRLWLDNIYIRLQPSDSSPDVLRAVDSASDNGGEMWVTRTTIQGDGAVAEGLDAGQPQPQGLTGIRSESLVYAHGGALLRFPGMGCCIVSSSGLPVPVLLRKDWCMYG